MCCTTHTAKSHIKHFAGDTTTVVLFQMTFKCIDPNLTIVEPTTYQLSSDMLLAQVRVLAATWERLVTRNPSNNYFTNRCRASSGNSKLFKRKLRVTLPWGEGTQLMQSSAMSLSLKLSLDFLDIISKSSTGNSGTISLCYNARQPSRRHILTAALYPKVLSLRKVCS